MTNEGSVLNGTSIPLLLSVQAPRTLWTRETKEHGSQKVEGVT